MSLVEGDWGKSVNFRGFLGNFCYHLGENIFTDLEGCDYRDWGFICIHFGRRNYSDRFFGNVFFEKTKIPDVIVLLFIGIILGPVSGLVHLESLHSLAEYVGSMALLVILFDGGMDLDLDRLLSEFGSAALLVLVSFSLTAAGIASYAYFIMGWELKLGLMLGAILGCTSAAIVIPIVNRLNTSEEIKTTLSVESALSDVLAVVLTISLIDAIQIGQKDPAAPVRAVVGSFSTAIVIGAFIGIVWLKILDLMRGKKLAYMLTLAAILITFGSVRVLGASGSIAVLVIGLVLGNSDAFTGFLKIKCHCLLTKASDFFMKK